MKWIEVIYWPWLQDVILRAAGDARNHSVSDGDIRLGRGPMGWKNCVS